MKRTTGGAAILAAVLAVAPIQLDAQQGPGRMQRQGMAPPGPGIEMILRQREQLELSQSQVEQLDKIRAEAVQRRTAHQAQMAELRSKVLAGEMKPEELRAVAEARRTAAVEVQKQQRERIEGVLNDAQKQKVETWRAQARGFRQGRMSAMRGQRGGAVGGGRQGMMGRRGGQGPGAGGRRFAPGGQQGPWGQGRGFMRGGLLPDTIGS